MNCRQIGLATLAATGSCFIAGCGGSKVSEADSNAGHRAAKSFIASYSKVPNKSCSGLQKAFEAHVRNLPRAAKHVAADGVRPYIQETEAMSQKQVGAGCASSFTQKWGLSQGNT